MYPGTEYQVCTECQVPGICERSQVIKYDVDEYEPGVCIHTQGKYAIDTIDESFLFGAVVFFTEVLNALLRTSIANIYLV